MEDKKRKTSIFFKVFSGVLLITILSNLIFAYIVYNGYEGIIVQIKPFLTQETFKNIQINIFSTWLMAAASFIFIIIMVILFTILLTSRMLKPLSKLLNIIKKAGKGNLNIQIEIESRDEIGELAEEINSMIKRLRVALEALEDEKKVLEIKVKARTKELEESAVNLDEQIQQRTKELRKRIEELERLHRLTVGRELKMLELKKQVLKDDKNKK